MFESKIFVKTNMVADNYVGRCVDGVIYAGGRVLEKPIGEYCDGTIYVSYGLNRHPVGTYKDGTIWSGIGLNRVIVGSYDAVDFYESYGINRQRIGHYEGMPEAAAAALLLRPEIEKENKITYIASRNNIDLSHARPERYRKPMTAASGTLVSKGDAIISKRDDGAKNTSGSSNGSRSSSSAISYVPVFDDGGGVVGGVVSSIVYLFILFVAVWLVGFTSEVLGDFRDVCWINQTRIERLISVAVVLWSLYFPICCLVKKETHLLGRCCIAGVIMLLGYGGLFYAIIHFSYEIYDFLSAEFLYYSGWLLHACGVLIMPFIGMCLFAAAVLLISSAFTIIFHTSYSLNGDFAVKQSQFVSKTSIVGGLILLAAYMLLEYSIARPFVLFLQFVLYGISIYCVAKIAFKMIDAFFTPDQF